MYPPDVSIPVPIFRAAERFVEITALSMALTFRSTRIAGAIAMIPTTPTKIISFAFLPLVIRAHRRATSTVVRTQRGCINVASIETSPAKTTRRINPRPFGSCLDLSIKPTNINMHAAIGLSYPMTNELSDSVGLKARATAIQSA